VGVQRILRTIFYATKLMFSFPGLFVSYYCRRRKAVGQFKRELIESGFSPSEAKELADNYPFKLGEVVSMARQFSRN
jgi:hypothetical protein